MPDSQERHALLAAKVLGEGSPAPLSRPLLNCWMQAVDKDACAYHALPLTYSVEIDNEADLQDAITWVCLLWPCAQLAHFGGAGRQS